MDCLNEVGRTKKVCFAENRRPNTAISYIRQDYPPRVSLPSSFIHSHLIQKLLLLQPSLPRYLQPIVEARYDMSRISIEDLPAEVLILLFISVAQHPGSQHDVLSLARASKTFHYAFNNHGKSILRVCLQSLGDLAIPALFIAKNIDRSHFPVRLSGLCGMDERVLYELMDECTLACNGGLPIEKREIRDALRVHWEVETMVGTLQERIQANKLDCLTVDTEGIMALDHRGCPSRASLAYYREFCPDLESCNTDCRYCGKGYQWYDIIYANMLNSEGGLTWGCHALTHFLHTFRNLKDAENVANSHLQSPNVAFLQAILAGEALTDIALDFYYTDEKFKAILEDDFQLPADGPQDRNHLFDEFQQTMRIMVHPSWGMIPRLLLDNAKGRLTLDDFEKWYQKGFSWHLKQMHGYNDNAS